MGPIMDFTNDTTMAGVHASLPTYEAVSGTVQCQHAALGENDLIDQNVPLVSLRLDGGTQSRAAMDVAAITEYTEAIRQGVTLPPLVTYFDGVYFWLADGYHRYHAYRAAGVDEVPAEVRTGSQRDAVLYSVGANAAHGLRRTNDDKRRAVKTLLSDAEWAAWSDNQIAKACGVSNHLVADVKVSFTLASPSDAPPDRTYTTKHGTTASMKTANIGKAKSEAPSNLAEQPAPETWVAQAPPQSASDELATLREENAALREELDSLKASFDDTLADNQMMGKVFDADDRMAAAIDEIKRMNVAVKSAEHTLMVKSDQCAEAIRLLNQCEHRAKCAGRDLAKGG
jgi:hypothetical protein